MKVVLYMAITPNGIIAKENDDTSWISEKEWDSYSLVVRTAGNLVIGSRTYTILTKQPEFSELKGVDLGVVTKNGDFPTLAQNHFVVNSPKESIQFLEGKGFSTAVVAGGGKLDGSFLKENLVDEIFLDVEPHLLGNGIPLFAGADFELELELLGTKLLSKNEIQLHYKVKK
jgi:dihydrofolate reductase